MLDSTNTGTYRRPTAKVASATVTTGAVGLVLWLLGTYVFHGDVPEPVVLAAIVLVPAAGAFLGGYFKKTSPKDRSAVIEGRL